MDASPPQLPPEEIYLTFTGSIDRTAVTSFSTTFTMLAAGKVKRAHLLLHSDGGAIDDGIFLHNFLNGIPLHLTTYDAGCIGSIALLPYLAGTHRCMSPSATLMMHPVHRGVSNSALEAKDTLEILKSIRRDDSRIDGILAAVPLPLPLRRARQRGRVVLTAGECVAAGLAHEIRDWAPPQGATVIAIPWQKQ